VRVANCTLSRGKFSFEDSTKRSIFDRYGIIIILKGTGCDSVLYDFPVVHFQSRKYVIEHVCFWVHASFVSMNVTATCRNFTQSEHFSMHESSKV